MLLLVSGKKSCYPNCVVNIWLKDDSFTYALRLIQEDGLKFVLIKEFVYYSPFFVTEVVHSLKLGELPIKSYAILQFLDMCFCILHLSHMFHLNNHGSRAAFLYITP